MGEHKGSPAIDLGQEPGLEEGRQCKGLGPRYRALLLRGTSLVQPGGGIEGGACGTAAYARNWSSDTTAMRKEGATTCSSWDGRPSVAPPPPFSRQGSKMEAWEGGGPIGRC